jgi:hypothetical protein
MYGTTNESDDERTGVYQNLNARSQWAKQKNNPGDAAHDLRDRQECALSQ